MAKFILPRQANVLLDQILDQCDTPEFLKTDGLFRMIGNKAEIKRAFKAFLSSPKDFELTKQQAILASPHNVVGLLIDTISSSEKPVKFSKEALNVLNDCLDKMANNTPTNPIDEMIDALVQADQLEEAKLFHNLFYLAHRVIQYAANNQVSVELITNALINSKFLEFSGLSPDDSVASKSYYSLLERIPQYSMPLIENSNRYQTRFGQLKPKIEIQAPPRVESIEVPKPVHHSDKTNVPSLEEISSTFVTEWSAAKKASKQDWLALISDFKVMGNFIKRVSTKVNELQSRLRSSHGRTKPKPKP